MWRKLFKILGVTVVCTEDFDGKQRYRFAKKTPFGLRCCAVLPFKFTVILNDDGTCSGPSSYVKRWKEV